MPEVEEQLRDYWTSIRVAQPPPTAADVMESAPIAERHGDHGPGRFNRRRQLLAAAAAVILVVGAVAVYALVGGSGDGNGS